MQSIIVRIGEKKLYALLNKLVLTLNGLLTVFIIIRAIPRYEFGLLTLFNTLDFVVFSLSGGVILQALQKYAAESESLTELFSSSVILYFSLALGVSALVLVFGKEISSFFNAASFETLLLWLPLFAILHIGRRLGYYMLLAREEVKNVFVIDFVPFIVTAVLSILLFYLGYLNSAAVVIAIRSGAELCSSLTAFLYLRKLVRFRFRFNRVWIGKLLNFGKFTLGTTIGNVIHTRIDILMISYFFNPAILAVYSAARGLADFFKNFVQAANMIVLPRASNFFSKDNLHGVRDIYYKGIIYSFCLITPVVLLLVLFPGALLQLAYGDKYLGGQAVLRVLAFAALISPLGTIGSSVASGIGKPHLTFGAMWASVVLNVILNWLFIPRFGTVGAALATLIAMTTGGIVITAMLHYYIRFAIVQNENSLLGTLRTIMRRL